LLRPLQQIDTCYSAYHLYIIQLNNSNTTRHKNAVTQLRAAGIIGHVHYIPIHLQPYYQTLGFKVGDFPNAEKYYQGAITIPLHPSLKEQEVHFVLNTLQQILN
jgi:dTDP-4-amino-4,6-dideoxygalactose transaminase